MALSDDPTRAESGRGLPPSMTPPRRFDAPLIIATLWFAALSVVVAARPNILWITSEDNSPYLGCYGDPRVQTPNLDQIGRAHV